MKNMQKYMVAVFGIIVAAFAVFSISVYAVGQCGEKSCGYWAGDCKPNEKCKEGFMYNACVPDTSCGQEEVKLTNYKINIFNVSVIERPDGFKLNITLNMSESNLPYQLTMDLIDVNDKKHMGFCFDKTKVQQNGYSCDYYLKAPVVNTQKGDKVLMSPLIPLGLAKGTYYVAIGVWKPGYEYNPTYRYDYKEFQNLRFDISGEGKFKLYPGLNRLVIVNKINNNNIGKSIQDFEGYSTKCGPNIWVYKVDCSWSGVTSSPYLNTKWEEKSYDYKFTVYDANSALVVYCAP